MRDWFHRYHMLRTACWVRLRRYTKYKIYIWSIRIFRNILYDIQYTYNKI